MLEDRYYQICKQNYPLRILVHATYQAKQTLAAKGITPAIFLSPYYMKKGEYSMEVGYGQKQRSYKPLPQISPIDFDQYDGKNHDQMMNQSMKQIISQSQYKIPKNVTKQTFSSRQSVQNYLNNINFHWFQDSVKTFYHYLSLNQANFKRSTLQQPRGIAFVLEVNNKSLKQNFQKIKKQMDDLMKRMFYLNPNHIKQIPTLAVVMFDSTKNYNYQDVKSYTDALKSQFGIQSVLTAKVQINNNNSIDQAIWSNYTRPLFSFNYKKISSDLIKFVNQDGSKALTDAINVHRQRIKKMIQNRLDHLFKRYDQYYSMGSKFFGFFKGNSTPKQKYFVTQQAQARQLGDLMFILQDYKKAYDVYKNIMKDFQKRDVAIQMDLKYVSSLCYQMGKFLGVKVSGNAPRTFLQKQAEQFQLFQKLGRKQLTKFLVLFLYEIHTFKIFDPALIKQKFLIHIKKAMNMSQDRKTEQQKHNKFHFLMPTLLYEQYSNLNLLYSYIDYRRYCYDTVRVSMKYAQYKLFTHALRCLLMVEGVYIGSISSMQKYVSVHLASDYAENKNFQQSLKSIKKAWKILAQNTSFQDYYAQTQTIQFKKQLANHGKIIGQIEKYAPQILSLPDDRNLVIPSVVQTDVILTGQQQIQQIDRTGISWAQISEFFNQNTQIYSQGYNKAAMQKIFKLYDCNYSEQKQLLYRVKCPNLSPAVIFKNSRISYLHEPIKLCFKFQNPFIQQIKISDFKVLIKDTYTNFQVINNPSNAEIIIKPHKKVDVVFEIIAKQTGLLQFQGLQWTFQKMRTKYCFKDIRNVQSQLKPFYTIIRIVQPKGKLKIYQNADQQLYQGQNTQKYIQLQNCGQKTIQSLYIAFGCHQFYGKKYEKINVDLKPRQKKQIKLNLEIPIVPQTIKKDWKIMNKKIFLYKTQGQFRVYRSSVTTLINKILFYKTICQKLSTHLHLLTFTRDKNYSKQAILQSMIIKSGFQITKTDKTSFQSTQVYYFFLSKSKRAQNQIFNFQTQMKQNYPNNLSLNKQRLKRLNVGNKQEQIQLVFGWKTSSKRNGLIQLKPLDITPLKQQVLPFSFGTSMPFTLRNNFQRNPVLQVNFEIRIKNIYFNNQVGIKIQMNQDGVNGIFWEGICQRYYRIKHDEQITFQANLIISKSGVFDISQCLKYTVQVQKQLPSIKHKDHEKLLMHVFDESNNYFQQNEDAIMSTSGTINIQNINLSDSSLLMSKKSIDNKEQKQFFISQPTQQETKTNNFINEVNSPRSPRFSKVVQADLLSKSQQKKPKEEDNLIDLL